MKKCTGKFCIYGTAFYLFALPFILLGEGVSAADDARTFVATRESNWFEHWHPQIEEAYPFGRSNQANDKKINLAKQMVTVSIYDRISNKHFLIDGDAYAVEWQYHAKWVKTGKPQSESSLCFAKVKDQQVISWTEYFDDTVGELQEKGTLPLYEEDELPFPWPEKAKIRRPYRP